MTESPTSDGLDVAISGGSMGGLFTGYALRTAGHAVDIFERSNAELQSRGAGIVAQPRMLDFMDTHDIVSVNEITTRTTQRQYLDRSGAVERERAETMTFTSWDGVYRCLRDGFPDEHYHTGRRTTGVERDRKAATIRFGNGETRHADLAVIAEGGQSQTRDELLPDVEPTYAGYIAWRGVIPEDAAPASVRNQFEDTFTFYHGSDDLILGYFIPGPNGGTGTGERRLNWVWYDDLRNCDERERLMTDEDGDHHEFAVPPGKLSSVVEDELHAAATDRLPDVFTDLVRTTDDPFVQTIYDLTVPEMVFGRVCLIGDCAFVARPHTAAGTAKAATDGIELAKAVSNTNDTAGALREWEDERLDAGRQLVATEKRMGTDYME
jgi:2-polyprenyl-6-methoxyphenol hydroxylase-like FAD-dependent oxidoreductase